MRTAIAAAGLLALVACKREPAELHTLSPYPNPFGPTEALWSAQPTREKPMEVVTSADGKTAYVSLPGTPDLPGHHVAVVDIESGTLVERIEVGSGPTGLALHPGGRFLVVLNRYSNHVSIIDTDSREVVARPLTDYYATEAVFSPDGRELYLTNHWRDAVAIWTIHVDDDELEVRARFEPGVPVGTNPRDISISEDGRFLAVAAVTGMTVSVIDTVERKEVRRIDVGAPANDVVFVDDYLIVPTLSAATHHLPLAGPDTDGDGRPGDSTPNVNFQDLQNEIAVYRASTGEQLWRYTSDTICCKDYRDVDPADLDRSGDLLPPRELWIVGGALPEQAAVRRSDDGTIEVFVVYSGSNELQRFGLDPDSGALTAHDVWKTVGHNPHGIAVTGTKVVVAHRLSETVGVYGFDGSTPAAVVVGDVSGGPYPATDAEIGELFNAVTASFSVDGDQVCASCHREGSNIDKAFSMPLTRYAGVGLRQTMAYRGSADTRPWFFEAAMDESNFKPVINEFARIENFCCSDYTLWPEGTPVGCTVDPPPECSSELNPSSNDGFDPARPGAIPHPRPTPHVSRDALFREASSTLFGRTTSFGDGLYFEHPISGERRPIALDFDGMTRALGLFLLMNPRLLPNPNDRETPGARRGRRLFESPETGCATCHPAPTYATSTDVNPFDAPIRVGPVVSPVQAEDGTNLDIFAGGFLDTFPTAEAETCDEVCGADACAMDADVCDLDRNVSFGVTSLRGIWDRAPSMLHHGRAKGLREVLCTPGHPALRDGERGFNERDGIIDSHGGTSHLTKTEIDDMIEFILSL